MYVDRKHYFVRHFMFKSASKQTSCTSSRKTLSMGKMTLRTLFGLTYIFIPLVKPLYIMSFWQRYLLFVDTRIVPADCRLSKSEEFDLFDPLELPDRITRMRCRTIRIQTSSTGVTPVAPEKCPPIFCTNRQSNNGDRLYDYDAAWTSWLMLFDAVVSHLMMAVCRQKVLWEATVVLG